ncbi:hypothetical protein [Candidatus Synechococcus spongiarum]|uniref:hypothetical protein n=1 Tax=Candidatus Synechococcus spongiarum TaxID=431041 RepID=UPI0011789956|nr:hypothetical protein [Candidatus Synechococcus spongiarum]
MQSTTRLLRTQFGSTTPNFHQLFTSGFDTPAEIRARWDLRLREARTASALMLLAAIEASFRVDYRQRNYRKNKKKDGLSRAFRDLYQEKGERVSLSDDMLQVWLGHPDVTSTLVGTIRAAFKYRHWLAHGRYWAPKLGRKYDFQTIYDLGRSIEDAFPFLRS